MSRRAKSWNSGYQAGRKWGLDCALAVLVGARVGRTGELREVLDALCEKLSRVRDKVDRREEVCLIDLLTGRQPLATTEEEEDDAGND